MFREKTDDVDKIMINKMKLKHCMPVRIVSFPFKNLQFIFRDYLYSKSEDSKVLKQMRNSKKGERCFIVGNGPSLKVADLDRIKNEFSFGSNRVYELFEKTKWRPTYYIATDPNFLDREGDRLPDLTADKIFLNYSHRKKIKNVNKKVLYLNSRLDYFSLKKYSKRNISISTDVSHHVSMGYTVTYIAIQLALYMGFSEIILIGMDHSYSKIVDSNGVFHYKENVVDHVFDDHSGSYLVFQYLEGTNFAYSLANIESQNRGVEILNATRGGKLEIFKRIQFEDLF